MKKSIETYSDIAALFATIQQIARRISYRESDDLAQKVALRLLMNPMSVPRQPGYFWIFRVVRNTARDSARQQCRKVVATYSLDSFYSSFQYSGGDRALQVAEPAAPEPLEPDTFPITLRAFRTLPIIQRRTLALHALGYNYLEISRLTETTLGTVRSRLHHARVKMRQYIPDYR